MSGKVKKNFSKISLNVQRKLPKENKVTLQYYYSPNIFMISFITKSAFGGQKGFNFFIIKLDIAKIEYKTQI